MRYAAILMALALLPAMAAADPAFVVHMNLYRNSTIQDFWVKAADDSYSYPDLGTAQYTISLYARNGSRYFSAAFEPVFEAFMTTNTNVHMGVDIDYNELYFTLPLIKQADRLVVENSGTKILDYPLDSVLCNRDGVCSNYEDADNCPADCVQKQRPIEGQQATQLPLIQVILLAVLVPLMAVLIIRKLRRHSHSLWNDSLQEAQL